MSVSAYYKSKHICEFDIQHIFILASLLLNTDVINTNVKLESKEQQFELLTIKLSAFRLSTFVALTKTHDNNFEKLQKSLESHEQFELKKIQQNNIFDDDLDESEAVLFVMKTTHGIVEKTVQLEHLVFLDNVYQKILEYYENLLKSSDFQQEVADHLIKTYNEYIEFQQTYKSFIQKILLA